MSSSPSTLADELLTAVVSGFGTAGITLPTERFVCHGLPAWDCEHVAVQYERGYRGMAGQEQPTAMKHGDEGVLVKSFSYAIWLTRCVPTLEDGGVQGPMPPTAAAMQTSAHELLDDSYHLLDSVLDAWYSGTFGTGLTIAILQVEPVGPEGAFGGNVLRLSLQLPD